MSEKIDKNSFKAYLAEARSWETSRVDALDRSARRAWWLAGFFGVLALAAVLAVSMLTPLKTVTPFVIRVDNSTGAVDVVRAIGDAPARYDEVVTKYFIQWYIRWREGYSRALAQQYYTNVGLLSSPDEQRRYYAFFNPKNPESPLKLYGEKSSVEVKIKSISFINAHVALVRYTKQVDDGPLTHWAATMTFGFASAPMSETDRAVNPLGFQVTQYRNDPDAQDAKGSEAKAAVVDGSPVDIPTPPAAAGAQPVTVPIAGEPVPALR